jgi:hypothetical protein
MTDQELLEYSKKQFNFRNKYKNNFAKFCEDMLGTKLLPYQKLYINALCGLDKTKGFVFGRTRYRRLIDKLQIEYMKAEEMDFYVYKPDGVDVYEKGKLVRTIKNEKGKE